MTPNQFFSELDSMVSAKHGNKWLKFQHMQCYIRVGERIIATGQRPLPSSNRFLCIQLANLSAPEQHQGKGIFTRLCQTLRTRYPDLPLYLENVLDPAWADALITRHQWQIAVNRGEYPPDLVLIPMNSPPATS